MGIDQLTNQNSSQTRLGLWFMSLGSSPSHSVYFIQVRGTKSTADFPGCYFTCSPSLISLACMLYTPELAYVKMTRTDPMQPRDTKLAGHVWLTLLYELSKFDED